MTPHSKHFPDTERLGAAAGADTEPWGPGPDHEPQGTDRPNDRGAGATPPTFRWSRSGFRGS